MPFAFLFANAFRWSVRPSDRPSSDLRVRWSALGLISFSYIWSLRDGDSVGECALINATNCTHTIFNATGVAGGGVKSERAERDGDPAVRRSPVDLHRFSGRDSHTLFMCIVRAK